VDDWLTYADVAPMRGAEFTAETADGRTVALTLTEATEFDAPGGSADGRTRSQFSLVFRGARDIPLDQGTYEIGGGQLAARPIFIVPIREDDEYRYYEAVFA
jgi:hypothetical protein